MSDEYRFIAIESKIAYQEDIVQTLGDTIIEQQRRISVLEERYQGLLQRVGALAVAAVDADPDEPPPHY